ncbi:MAG: WecB/TagA/CpsF family glycosyltransferase [Spirochaetales bacterium]|nr:WecB/TagA/CpsF family glycosyltransferase [Spirochaetales bacterium]
MTRERINVGGLLFDNVNMREALMQVQEKIEHSQLCTEESSLLMAANQDIFNHVGKYKNLSLDRLNRAFLIIPDGYSIILGAKYLGTPLKERVAGPDLMNEFMVVSAQKGYRNFFLGAAEGVAAKMAENFLAKYPDLQISGVYSPPFGDFSEEEKSKIKNMINESNSDVLWVSFGCPKQEWWILEHEAELNVPVIAGIGAAFDFHSGNKKRAPLFLQKLKLEWLFRLLQEPARLWKRYFVGAKTYLGLLRKQKSVVLRKQKKHKH